MKNYLLPFLFFCSTLVAQNTANKDTIAYKTNERYDQFFSKPLRGKIKMMHTVGCKIEYLGDTPVAVYHLFHKNKINPYTYTYHFDKRGNDIAFYTYDALGNLMDWEIKTFNKEDSLTYRKISYVIDSIRHSAERFNLYNDKNLLVERKDIDRYGSKVSIYSYNEEDNIIKEEDYYKDKLFYTALYTYDAKGKLLEKKEKEKNPKKHSTTIYEYDTLGNLIRITEKEKGEKPYILTNRIYENNTLIKEYDDHSYVLYTYKEGKLIEIESYYTGIGIDYIIDRKVITKYNEKGQIIEKLEYQGNILEQETNYFYDENGKEIKGTSYKKGQEKSTWENKYSPEGYLIEKAWKREKGNPKTLYYYDAIGNCIKIEEYYKGKLTNIYERTFTYYE